jgi:hypothetical protein
VFAILFLLREMFLLYKGFRLGELNVSTWRLIGTGLSISYITTIIFAGLGI